MNIVEINESNYQGYTKLDIVAVSYAEPGAMGEGSGIYIIDKAGQIYHANYNWGENCIHLEHIDDIIPYFTDIRCGLLDCDSSYKNWKYKDLGFGNHLFMTEGISDGFNKMVEENNYKGFGVLFQHWPGIVLSLLGKGESNLTMNDIWEIAKN